MEPDPSSPARWRVVTGAYLAAVYLAADAARAGVDDLVRGFRARALGTGAVAGALAIAGLAVVHGDAPALYDGLTTGAGLVCARRLGRQRASRRSPSWPAAATSAARFSAAVAVAAITSAGASPSIRRCFPAA